MFLKAKRLTALSKKEVRMSETMAIILRFREEDAEQCESAFKAEVYPLWEEFKTQGKFISASLTPALGSSKNEKKDGFRDYILHVEVPSRAEHEEFDSEPRFLPFLGKFRAMQPEDPK